ncbi:MULTISPECIES: YjcZ family sporulation protein [unclassified Sporolactobacillus]|nr:YjcZ family sporulation protein [Sporolactobacillus sp. CQH2019]MDD9149675.1 YjcZ family sporulation protein [Sporolactobacillus sp. CQH2019]
MLFILLIIVGAFFRY